MIAVAERTEQATTTVYREHYCPECRGFVCGSFAPLVIPIGVHKVRGKCGKCNRWRVLPVEGGVIAPGPRSAS